VGLLEEEGGSRQRDRRLSPRRHRRIHRGNGQACPQGKKGRPSRAVHVRAPREPMLFGRMEHDPHLRQGDHPVGETCRGYNRRKNRLPGARQWLLTKCANTEPREDNRPAISYRPANSATPPRPGRQAPPTSSALVEQNSTRKQAQFPRPQSYGPPNCGAGYWPDQRRMFAIARFTASLPAHFDRCHHASGT